MASKRDYPGANALQLRTAVRKAKLRWMRKCRRLSNKLAWNICIGNTVPSVRRWTEVGNAIERVVRLDPVAPEGIYLKPFEPFKAASMTNIVARAVLYYH